jgi:excisionase family DNA binding protein
MTNILIQNITKKELQELITLCVQNVIVALADVQKTEVKEEFISKKEAAEYLNVSLPTLSKYVQAGWVKAYSLSGSRIKFKKNELDGSFIQFNKNKNKFYGR